jgi:hypothetical protein
MNTDYIDSRLDELETWFSHLETDVGNIVSSVNELELASFTTKFTNEEVFNLQNRVIDLECMVIYLFDRLKFGTQTKDYVEFIKNGRKN